MSALYQNTYFFKTACRFFNNRKAPAGSLKRSKHGLGRPKCALSKKARLSSNKKMPAALNDSRTWLGVTEAYKNAINIDYY